MKKVLKEETMRKIWGTVEPVEVAKVYLLKKMQEELFPSELKFLKGTNSVVPDRIQFVLGGVSTGRKPSGHPVLLFLSTIGRDWARSCSAQHNNIARY